MLERFMTHYCLVFAAVLAGAIVIVGAVGVVVVVVVVVLALLALQVFCLFDLL